MFKLLDKLLTKKGGSLLDGARAMTDEEKAEQAEARRTWIKRLRRYFRHYTTYETAKTTADLEKYADDILRDPRCWNAILLNHGPEQDPPFAEGVRPEGFKKAEHNKWKSDAEMHAYWTKRLVRYYSEYEPDRTEEDIEAFVRTVHWAHWGEVWSMILKKYGREPLTVKKKPVVGAQATVETTPAEGEKKTTEAAVAREAGGVPTLPIEKPKRGERGYEPPSDGDDSSSSNSADEAPMRIAAPKHVLAGAEETEWARRKAQGAREVFKMKVARYQLSKMKQKDRHRITHDLVSEICSRFDTAEELEDQLWPRMVDEMGPPPQDMETIKLPRDFYSALYLAYESQCDPFQAEEALDEWARAGPGGWGQMTASLVAKYDTPPPDKRTMRAYLGLNRHVGFDESGAHSNDQLMQEVRYDEYNQNKEGRRGSGAMPTHLSRYNFWSQRVTQYFQQKKMDKTEQQLRDILDRMSVMGWHSTFSSLQGHHGKEDQGDRENFQYYKEYWIGEAQAQLDTKGPLVAGYVASALANKNLFDSPAGSLVGTSGLFDPTGGNTSMGSGPSAEVRQVLVDDYFAAWPRRDSRLRGKHFVSVGEHWKRCYQSCVLELTGAPPDAEPELAVGGFSSCPPPPAVKSPNASKNVSFAAGNVLNHESFATPRSALQEFGMDRDEETTSAQGDEVEPVAVFQYWHDKIMRFYTKWCPAKADPKAVEALLDRIGPDPQERNQMFEMLVVKYGSPPPSPRLLVEKEYSQDEPRIDVTPPRRTNPLSATLSPGGEATHLTDPDIPPPPPPAEPEEELGATTSPTQPPDVSLRGPTIDHLIVKMKLSRRRWKEKVLDYLELKAVGKSVSNLQLEMSMDSYEAEADQGPNPLDPRGGSKQRAPPGYGLNQMWNDLLAQYGFWEEPSMDEGFYQHACHLLRQHHLLSHDLIRTTFHEVQEAVQGEVRHRASPPIAGQGTPWKQTFNVLERRHGQRFDLTKEYHQFIAQKRHLCRGAAKDGEIVVKLGGKEFWRSKMLQQRAASCPWMHVEAVDAIMETSEMNGRSHEETFVDFVKLCAAAKKRRCRT